jgi:hypothetical protein
MDEQAEARRDGQAAAGRADSDHAEGLEIGIPTRGELADAFRKITRPAKKP